MLEFNDGRMTLTRGDTAYIDTVILTPLGFVYEPKEEDVIMFYVYRKDINSCDRNPVIKKQFINRKLKIETSDTEFLRKGNYYYKCVITMKDNLRETYCEGDFILK